MAGAYRQILHPAAGPEPDRVELEIGGAETEQLAPVLGHKDARVRIGDRAGDRLARPLGVPARRHRARRREEPLVHAEHPLDLSRFGLADLSHVGTLAGCGYVAFPA